MATEEPMEEMMFIIRMVPAMIFILFMMVIFFSFKVHVRIDDMQRFNMEMADVITGSALAAQQGVFSPAALNRVGDGLALYARTCEYEYNIIIESVGAKRKCSSDEECRDYCSETGSTEYDCNFELFSNNFCECKKDGAWHSGYYWSVGYSARHGLLEYNSQEFPVGLITARGVVPARLTVTAQDSLLTRLSCISQKAYETRQNVSFNVVISQLPGMQQSTVMYFGRKFPGDNNLCLHAEGGVIPDDCRYMPDVPVEPLNIDEVNVALLRTSRGTITAYPLKADTTCDRLTGYIAENGDEVEKILLCAK